MKKDDEARKSTVPRDRAPARPSSRGTGSTESVPTTEGNAVRENAPRTDN